MGIEAVELILENTHTRTLRCFKSWGIYWPIKLRVDPVLNIKFLARTVRMWWLTKFTYQLNIVGTGSYIGYSTFIKKNCLSIGTNTFIGNNCHLSCPAILGTDVMLASRVSIVGGDHAFEVPGQLIRNGELHRQETVVVEDDAWVGHGVTLLHGVNVGVGSIVAAGSVVTKNVEPYTIVAGVPAIKIRRRFRTIEDEQLHLKLISEKSL